MAVLTDRDVLARTPLLVTRSKKEGLRAVAVVVTLDAAGAALVDLDSFEGAAGLFRDVAARGARVDQHAVEVGEHADVLWQ